ncbi:MAG: 2-dehydropantoate 2-reductase, partial [Candidatus Eremiobacteraeota bacterium]|nr:2-dehydropantoate 2-reductase [Candidatus Eremiobacteraeota bacterium]
MRILVVGAGATGGYFGGRLAEAGRDVTFLVRPGRAESLARDGLRIESPHGNAKIHPQFLTAADVAAPYDVVLLTVKGYALGRALEDIAPAIGPETTIVPVLNGMRHLDVLRARFGDGPVVGGVCIVSTHLEDDGRIVQLADLQELIYGEIGGGTSPRVVALDRALQGAGFSARLSEHIVREMWEKWVMLAALGGITCSMRGTIG